MSLMEQNKESYLQLKNENDKYIQKKKIIRDLLDKESIKSIFEKVLKKKTDLTNDNIEFLNLLKKSNYDIDIFIDNYIKYIAEESVDSENERDEEDRGDGEDGDAELDAELDPAAQAEAQERDEDEGAAPETPEQASVRALAAGLAHGIQPELVQPPEPVAAAAPAAAPAAAAAPAPPAAAAAAPAPQDPGGPLTRQTAATGLPII